MRLHALQTSHSSLRSTSTCSGQTWAVRSLHPLSSIYSFIGGSSMCSSQLAKRTQATPNTKRRGAGEGRGVDDNRLGFAECFDRKLMRPSQNGRHTEVERRRPRVTTIHSVILLSDGSTLMTRSSTSKAFALRENLRCAKHICDECLERTKACLLIILDIRNRMFIHA